MPEIDLDEDALVAAADVVGRTGATGFEIGYVHDNVPVHLAGWYAHAQYRGARIVEEDHAGPAEAAEALARRVLTGGRCTHCGALVVLSGENTIAVPRLMLDGTSWTEPEIRAAGQCQYRREGK